ncbi:MFS transporter [Anaerobiospirillum thomasii]|uniref:Fosmidomycin resistance protein n=1 Tax=Anaerobiospirillum thomasii TaxID=179995 RepID=A0A2X0WR78_9GAMM|nr:MFS transporter [Anaerobiospirillum thomasii]SPT69072.1 Fosmidomycin resistance protein [Anaerobiospirillum thomasii]
MSALSFFVRDSIAIPQRSWPHVTLLGTCHFMSDFYTNILPVMLPILALRFDISYAQCAALFMVFSVTMNFIQPFIGIVSDRRNLNYLMPLSIATATIFACLISLAPNIITLVLIVFLVGLCSSLFHPVSASVLSLVTPKHKPGLATSIFIVGGNLGFAIAPFLIAKYIEVFSDKYLIVISIPALITVALVYRRGLHIGVKKDKKDEKAFSVKSLFKNKEFILLNLAMGLRSWGYCAIVVFLTLLLSKQGYDSVNGAGALMVALLGCVAGGLIGGSVSDKFGSKAVIVFTLIVALVCFGYFLFNPYMTFLSLTALFLSGFGLYGSTAPAIVWLQSMLKNAASFATSLMLGLSFGFGYVATLITGFVADYVDLQSALIYTTLPALFAATLIMMFIKRPVVHHEH